MKLTFNGLFVHLNTSFIYQRRNFRAVIRETFPTHLISASSNLPDERSFLLLRLSRSLEHSLIFLFHQRKEGIERRLTKYSGFVDTSSQCLFCESVEARDSRNGYNSTEVKKCKFLSSENSILLFHRQLFIFEVSLFDEEKYNGKRKRMTGNKELLSRI